MFCEGTLHVFFVQNPHLFTVGYQEDPPPTAMLRLDWKALAAVEAVESIYFLEVHQWNACSEDVPPKCLQMSGHFTVLLGFDHLIHLHFVCMGEVGITVGPSLKKPEIHGGFSWMTISDCRYGDRT